MIETKEEFDRIMFFSHVDDSDGIEVCDACLMQIGEHDDCHSCRIYRLKATIEKMRISVKARMRRALEVYGEPDEHFDAFLHGAFPDLLEIPLWLRDDD